MPYSAISYPCNNQSRIGSDSGSPLAPGYEDASQGLPTSGIWVGHFQLRDLNLDGQTDLLCLGARKGGTGSHVHMWDMDESGNWVDVSLDFGLDQIPHSSYGGLKLGDINNDGLLDIGTGSHGADRVDVYTSDVTWNWTRSSSGLEDAGDGWDVDFGDFNNEGHLDFLTGGFWTNKVQAFAGDGSGHWVGNSSGLPITITKVPVEFGDINNDGNLDIATGCGNNNWESFGEWVFIGDGEGHWTNASNGLPVDDSTSEDVSLGDINGDGFLDVVLIRQEGIKVYTGDGTGNWSEASNGLPITGDYTGVKLADMDNDGYDDLVATSTISLGGWPPTYHGKIEVYKSDGQGGWSDISNGLPSDVDGKSWQVDVGDIDHNGYLDIVAGFGSDYGSYPGSIQVWKNNNVPDQLSARLLSPNGKEVYKEGSIREIKWLTSIPSDQGPGKIKLEFSASGESGPYELIADNISNSNFYQWQVPNNPSADCYVKVTITDINQQTAFDKSDAPFEILHQLQMPEPPTNVTSELTGSSFENVTIQWNLSKDDSAGKNNVNNYAIYRNKSYENNGLSYDFLAEIPNGTNYYVDNGAGDGDSNNYFYYIQANSTSGENARNETQVAKYVREMPYSVDAPRQLISMPLGQSDTNISIVLQTIQGSYNHAQWYGPLDTTDHWKTNATFKPKAFDDLFNVDHKMALWITMTSPDNLTIAGKVPKQTSIQLYEGWNLVSYASFINRTVGDALSDIWENVTQVEGFNETSSPYYLKILTDEDVMRTGEGYWIEVTNDCEWVVYN